MLGHVHLSGFDDTEKITSTVSFLIYVLVLNTGYSEFLFRIQHLNILQLSKGI